MMVMLALPRGCRRGEAPRKARPGPLLKQPALWRFAFRRQRAVAPSGHRARLPHVAGAGLPLSHTGNHQNLLVGK